MKAKRRYKPSTFFKRADYTRPDVLKVADRLKVRISHLEDGEFLVEMPGVGAAVRGFGVYTVVEMIVSGYLHGRKAS